MAGFGILGVCRSEGGGGFRRGGECEFGFAGKDDIQFIDGRDGIISIVELANTLYDAIDKARLEKITVTKNTFHNYYNAVNLIVHFNNNCLRYVIAIPMQHICLR